MKYQDDLALEKDEATSQIETISAHKVTFKFLFLLMILNTF